MARWHVGEVAACVSTPGSGLGGKNLSIEGVSREKSAENAMSFLEYVAHRVGVRDRRVADACNAARVKLGDCYRDGLCGCAVNSERAAFYYHMAGEAGDARGMERTGLSLVGGFGAVGTSQYCLPRILKHIQCIQRIQRTSTLQCALDSSALSWHAMTWRATSARPYGAEGVERAGMRNVVGLTRDTADGMRMLRESERRHRHRKVAPGLGFIHGFIPAAPQDVPATLISLRECAARQCDATGVHLSCVGCGQGLAISVPSSTLRSGSHSLFLVSFRISIAIRVPLSTLQSASHSSFLFSFAISLAISVPLSTFSQPRNHRSFSASSQSASQSLFPYQLHCQLFCP